MLLRPRSTKAMIERHWNDPHFHLLTRKHFYHVGSTEDLRHPMIEALITSFPVHAPQRESETSGVVWMLLQERKDKHCRIEKVHRV